MIRIKHLSKEYKINKILPQQTFRDRFGELFSAVNWKNRRRDKFFALDDLNLEIKKGEAIGVIGPNGSGKSTLLKIISKVTQPTSGTVSYQGKVSSIIEIGSGFHPELTGRENIYLNSAILGMKKKKIRGKIKDILDFSGIDDFIDTPLKKYSSGMYVRLAFSVLIHLDSDIILIDEVLAVGDLDFQKKCIAKVMEMKRKLNKTIIFVSHNTDAIQAICDKCMFLNKGKMLKYGKTDQVVMDYLSYVMNDKIKVSDNTNPYVRKFEVRNSRGGTSIKTGDRLKIIVELSEKYRCYKQFRIVIGIYNNYSQLLIRIDSGDRDVRVFADNRIFIETDPVQLSGVSCYANIAIFFDGIMLERSVCATRFNINGDSYLDIADKPILSVSSKFIY